MPLRFSDTRPIYQQLCDHFEAKLLSGSLRAGEKLPSVRDLAMDIGVNPNTMQKALSLMENRGLMFSERTSGRFITHDESVIDGLRGLRTKQIKRRFFSDMEKIGYQREEALEILRQGDT